MSILLLRCFEEAAYNQEGSGPRQQHDREGWACVSQREIVETLTPQAVGLFGNRVFAGTVFFS